MKYILSVFILSFFLLPLQAQNYRLFPANNDLFFKGGENIYTLHIDSVEVVGSDSIFHNYRVTNEVAGLPGGCTLFTEDTSWLNTKFIRSGNTYYLFNKAGDTITIRRNTSFGDSFVLYEYPNGDEIIVTHAGDFQAAIFGTSDYTKVLRMTVQDSGGNPIVNEWTDKDILLSTLYGVISFYNIYDFPSDTTVLELFGHSEPISNMNNGRRMVNAENVFDHSLGNEFHYRTYYEICGFAGCREELTKEKRFVISRDTSMNGDTLLYTYQHFWIKYIDDPVDGLDTLKGMDTITEAIVLADHAFLDSMDRELLFWDGEPGYSEVYCPDNMCFRLRKEIFLNYTYDSANDCLTPASPADTLPKYIYGAGIGNTYFATDTPGVSFYEREMVYYQRGIEQWGTPYDFSILAGIDENGFPGLKVFPNPANDHIYVSSGVQSELEVNIYTVAGVKVVYEMLGNGKGLIDISGLSPGIYFLNIRSEGNMKTIKIVKQL